MSLFNHNDAKRLLNRDNRYNNQNNQQRQNRNNKNNQNNQQRQNRNNQRKNHSLFSGRADEIIRRFDNDQTTTEANNATENNTAASNQVEAVTDVLTAFSTAFSKNMDKPTECRDIIESYFEDVVAAMRYYYDPKFESALSAMNKIIDLMSTNYFATTLLGILKQNTFEENWSTMWKDVAFTISLVLSSSANKMKEGTVQIYVSDILSSNGMWKTEITQLVEELGITEDLATDVIISLPVRPEDMNDLNMRSIYKEFLYTILNHADDNIEVLDRGTQRKLFDFCFEDGKKLATKVIGRFLSSEDVAKNKELEGAESLVYGEFKAMLYEKLESYDVHDIAFVLRFIVEQKKRNNAAIIFNAEDAAKYDTIRKAIMQVVSKDDSAKSYLV